LWLSGLSIPAFTACIHGTYFALCAWCRLLPTPPGGPSKGHGFDGGAGAVRGGWRRRPHGAESLCTQERWSPEVVNKFDAAARSRRATVGRSHDDSHPDNSALHEDKIYSFPPHISRVALLLLRKRRGAAAATWAPRSSTCEKKTSGAAGIGLGTTIKYPQRTTDAAAGNGLGTTPNYLRGAAG
jgi:hypothetical protein